jgi:hypothetical protein
MHNRHTEAPFDLSYRLHLRLQPLQLYDELVTLGRSSVRIRLLNAGIVNDRGAII